MLAAAVIIILVAAIAAVFWNFGFFANLANSAPSMNLNFSTFVIPILLIIVVVIFIAVMVLKPVDVRE
jgi:hypothetical protein